MNSLKALYIDQLQDLFSANRQSLAATQKLVDSATDGELVEALKRGVSGIEEGKKVLEGIVKRHGADPSDEFCKGMEGLVKEVQAHVFDTDFADDAVRDAMIIAQYQRMAHYAIAGYGCCVAFAKRLGLETDAPKLQTCLDETYGGDRVMSGIAEREVNKAAA